MFPYSSLLVAVRNTRGKPFFHLSAGRSGMGNNCEGGDERSEGTNELGSFLAGRGAPALKEIRPGACSEAHWRLPESTLSLCRRGLTSQAALESAQSVKGIIQSLIFFNGVGTAGEQLSGPRDDGLFGVRNALRKFLPVLLKQCSFVEFAPTRHTEGGSGRA